MRAISRIRCGCWTGRPDSCEGGGEAAAVVEAEVRGEVLVLTEREPLFAQDAGEQRLVQRLVVDQNAVEVEQDGAQHVARIIAPRDSRPTGRRPCAPPI